jgi:hypothetical protein
LEWPPTALRLNARSSYLKSGDKSPQSKESSSLGHLSFPVSITHSILISTASEKTLESRRAIDD